MRLKLVIGLIFVLVVLTFFNTYVFASFSNFQRVGLFFDNRNNLLRGTRNHSLDIELDGMNNVGFFTLFGDNVWTLVDYRGEIPITVTGNNNFRALRFYPAFTIDGDYRAWSLPGGRGFSMTNNNITPLYAFSSPSFHLMALANNSRNGAFIFAIGNSIYWISTIFLEFIIMLQTIDLQIIFNLVNEDNIIGNLFMTLFLRDAEGNFSFFFLVMLSLWAVSIVKISVRILIGREGIQRIFQEIGIFFIVAIFFAISIISLEDTEIDAYGNVQGGSRFARIAMNFVGYATAQALVNIDEEFDIHIYSRQDYPETRQEIMATLLSMIRRPYLHTVIEAQFGVPVSALDFSNLGIAYDQTGTDMRVTTGNAYRANLGYFWYAANSNVHHRTWEPATTNRLLFVIDALDLSYSINPNPTARIAASRITAPIPTWGLGRLIILSVFMLMLSFALLSVVLFTLYGSIIMIFGVLAFPILPGLIMFEKTRETAKELVMVYLISILRFIVGSSVFYIILFSMIVISSGGIYGILVGIVLCYFIGKQMPNISENFNRVLARHEPRYMDSVNGYFKAINTKISKPIKGMSTVATAVNERASNLMEKTREAKGAKGIERKELTESLREERTGLRERVELNVEKVELERTESRELNVEKLTESNKERIEPRIESRIKLIENLASSGIESEIKSRIEPKMESKLKTSGMKSQGITESRTERLETKSRIKTSRVNLEISGITESMPGTESRIERLGTESRIERLGTELRIERLGTESRIKLETPRVDSKISGITESRIERPGTESRIKLETPRVDSKISGITESRIERPGTEPTERISESRITKIVKSETEDLEKRTSEEAQKGLDRDLEIISNE